ncbi:MAG: response regulator [Plectolyngbya sp. WJT66-NPBG17]|nr:response regulator [Plectolyngbya sp. WJT66-NPBG17]MBW4527810.1 response regulator [Phormidium tanganyikae FI6-MK23]
MAIQTSVLNSSQVLIVEDEAVTRTALTVLLEYQGAIVVSVGSIQEGIHAIKSGFQPELLVSNIRLPDGNGARVLEAVRQQDLELGRQTVAIALTGEAIEMIRVDPDSAGFEVYLPKPYDSGILLRTIARLMSDERRE